MKMITSTLEVRKEFTSILGLVQDIQLSRKTRKKQFKNELSLTT